MLRLVWNLWIHKAIAHPLNQQYLMVKICRTVDSAKMQRHIESCSIKTNTAGFSAFESQVVNTCASQNLFLMYFSLFLVYLYIHELMFLIWKPLFEYLLTTYLNCAGIISVNIIDSMHYTLSVYRSDPNSKIYNIYLT